jgi:hypothetical protein
MSMDLTEFDVRAVPKTAALREQKQLTFPPEIQWWFEKLADSRILERHDFWEREVVKDELYEDYVKFMQRLGVARKVAPTTLGRQLRRVCPGEFPRSYQKDVHIPIDDGYGRTITIRKRKYHYQLPDVAEARLYFDKMFGGPYEWVLNEEVI